MKMAMIEVDKKLVEISCHPELVEGSNQISRQARNDKTPRQLLQIHDSIMVECPAEQADEVAKMMDETMENIYPKLLVKLKVDVKIGKTWGDL
jgi:DNA polymerase I-like protein with 3'-5' exonuclease and polymerase domains